MIPSPSNDPRAATDGSLAHLIESGVELVRAEIAVTVARGRQAFLRALAALLATLLAAALLQVSLVAFLLSPLLLRTLPSESVWTVVALPAVLALASTGGAVLAWRSTRSSLQAEPAPDAPAPAPDFRGPSPLLAASRLAASREGQVEQ